MFSGSPQLAPKSLPLLTSLFLCLRDPQFSSSPRLRTQLSRSQRSFSHLVFNEQRCQHSSVREDLSNYVQKPDSAVSGQTSGSLCQSCILEPAAHNASQVVTSSIPYDNLDKRSKAQNPELTLSGRSASQPQYRPRKSLSEKIWQHKEDKKLANRIWKDRGITFHGLLTVIQDNFETQFAESGKEDEGSVRAVWFRPETRQLHVNSIPRPTQWSPITFLGFVETIISSSVDRTIKSQIYGKYDSHMLAVAQTLERLFASTGRKELLSPAAFNAALRFFIKNNLMPKAVSLFTQMESLHVTVQTETFNIMLDGAASQKDLYTFSFLLDRMILRGIKPNEGTYVALLKGVESGEDRMVIVRSMRSRGLLNRTSTLKGVVGLVIRDELSSYLDNGLNLESFFQFMDSRYGTGWLSIIAVNKVLHEVGRRRIPDAIHLLDQLMKDGLRPDDVTLQTLLDLCSLQNERQLLISVLRMYERWRHVRLGQAGYETLFKMAWNNKLYNCARVIWRSACVQAVTTYKMNHSVHCSLMSESEAMPAHDVPKSRGQIWLQSAGLVVLGIVPGQNFQESALLQETPVSQQLRTELGKQFWKVRQRELRAALDRDIATAGHYRITTSLSELLSTALALDTEWKASGAWKHQSTRWKWENAIAVEVEWTGPHGVHNLG